MFYKFNNKYAAIPRNHNDMTITLPMFDFSILCLFTYVRCLLRYLPQNRTYRSMAILKGSFFKADTIHELPVFF